MTAGKKTPEELGAELLRHIALAAEDLSGAAALIGAGADLEARDVHGMTPLLRAVHGEKAQTAVFLLNCGADPEAQGTYGHTALMLAAARGMMPVAAALLAKNVSVEVETVHGETVLDFARRARDPETGRMIGGAVAAYVAEKARLAKELHAATRAFRDGLAHDITLDPPLEVRRHAATRQKQFSS